MFLLKCSLPRYKFPWGISKVLWKIINNSSHNFMKPSKGKIINWTSAANNEIRIMKIWASKKLQWKLGLIIIMVNHGVWVHSISFSNIIFTIYIYFFTMILKLLVSIHQNVLTIMKLDDPSVWLYACEQQTTLL